MNMPSFSQLLTLSVTLFLSIPLSTQQQISTVDLNALRQIKHTLTDVKNGRFFSTWNFTQPENVCSSFNGVTCSVINRQLRVTSLFLGTGLSDSPGLAGTLSAPGLYALTELTQLILYPGIVTGYIPSQIGHHLKNLRVISLTYNRLTGTIPLTISKLRYLHTLDLGHNDLNGVIPPLPDVKVLILAYNKLAGNIPEFSDRSRVIHIDLQHNMLTGTLPVKIPLTLRYLSLSSNGLWGPLQSLLPLSNLVYLDLSMNEFSGPIQGSLFRSTLSSMYLQRNNFSDVAPPQPSISYGPGSTVDLSHNVISGDIPDFLDGVETLFLNNNRFTGGVPENYVSDVFSGTMRTLYVQHNYVTSFWMEESKALPEGVALCLSYNCMVPPAVGLTACPASAGELISRPLKQCSVFNNGNSIG